MQKREKVLLSAVAKSFVRHTLHHHTISAKFRYFWFCVNLDSTNILWRVALHSPPFAYNALSFFLLQSGGAPFSPPLTSTFLGLLRNRLRDGAYDPYCPCSHSCSKEQRMLAGHCFYQPRPAKPRPSASPPSKPSTRPSTARPATCWSTGRIRAEA